MMFRRQFIAILTGVALCMTSQLAPTTAVPTMPFQPRWPIYPISKLPTGRLSRAGRSWRRPALGCWHLFRPAILPTADATRPMFAGQQSFCFGKRPATDTSAPSMGAGCTATRLSRWPCLMRMVSSRMRRFVQESARPSRTPPRSSSQRRTSRNLPNRPADGERIGARLKVIRSSVSGV